MGSWLGKALEEFVKQEEETIVENPEELWNRKTYF